MNQTRLVLFALFGALLFGLYLKTEINTNEPQKTQNQGLQAKVEAALDSVKENTPQSPAVPVRTLATTESEQASLSRLSELLAEYSKPAVRLKDLVQQLDKDGQAPLVTHDSNEATGEMAIVRTQSPLPGTRYFHAQFFNDGDYNSFAQHISFEYRPSPSALKEAIASIRRTFSLGEPEVSREDYAKWKLDDGHIIWVKKMAHEDLKDDPFNAYTEADIGTVRVAVEAEIH